MIELSKEEKAVLNYLNHIKNNLLVDPKPFEVLNEFYDSRFNVFSDVEVPPIVRESYLKLDKDSQMNVINFFIISF